MTEKRHRIDKKAILTTENPVLTSLFKEGKYGRKVFEQYFFLVKCTPFAQNKKNRVKYFKKCC